MSSEENRNAAPAGVHAERSVASTASNEEAIELQSLTLAHLKSKSPAAIFSPQTPRAGDQERLSSKQKLQADLSKGLEDGSLGVALRAALPNEDLLYGPAKGSPASTAESENEAADALIESWVSIVDLDSGTADSSLCGSLPETFPEPFTTTSLGSTHLDTSKESFSTSSLRTPYTGTLKESFSASSLRTGSTCYPDTLRESVSTTSLGASHTGSPSSQCTSHPDLMRESFSLTSLGGSHPNSLRGSVSTSSRSGSRSKHMSQYQRRGESSRKALGPLGSFSEVFNKKIQERHEVDDVECVPKLMQPTPVHNVLENPQASPHSTKQLQIQNEIAVLKKADDELMKEIKIIQHNPQKGSRIEKLRKARREVQEGIANLLESALIAANQREKELGLVVKERWQQVRAKNHDQRHLLKENIDPNCKLNELDHTKLEAAERSFAKKRNPRSRRQPKVSSAGLCHVTSTVWK